MLQDCTVAAVNSKSLVTVSEISYNRVSAESALENLQSVMSSYQYIESWRSLKITFFCENFLRINLFMGHILTNQNCCERNIS